MIRPILIVDDEAAVTLALEGFFESKGYPVLRAFYGDQAIARIEKEHPSVAVLDLQMPGVDGVAVLEKIRQSHPDIKTLVITGHSEKYQKDLDRLKPDAIMLKPVSLEDLTREIDALLGGAVPSVSNPPRQQPSAASLRLLFVGWPAEQYAKFLKPYFEKSNPPDRMVRYETAVASEPGEAFHLIKEFKPNLVLLENSHLPVGMDAGKLAADLSRLTEPSLEVILHTSEGPLQLRQLEETIQRTAERRGWVPPPKGQ